MSSTFTFSPPCVPAMPSVIMFKQNGQAVASVRAPKKNERLVIHLEVECCRICAGEKPCANVRNLSRVTRVKRRLRSTLYPFVSRRDELPPDDAGGARCIHWLFLRYLSKNALTIGRILSPLTVCPCEVISRVVSTPAALSAAANNSP